MRIDAKKRRSLILLLVALIVALATLGCGSAGLFGRQTQSETATPPPTATTAPPPNPVTGDENEMVTALETEITQAYEAVSPAVVNITSRSTVYGWFGQAMPQEGSGSGFVYDREGHIVTNFHVIEGADELTVTFGDGQTYDAELVGSDAVNDLAVLKIDAGGDLPDPLPLADSSQLRVGQYTLAIGNPFGLDQTLTTGVISALGRVIESPEDNRFIGEAIQTDAAINPGNSGGPLLDLQGRVVGVNSQIISPSGASAGVGFAVSSNTVRRVVPVLIEQGEYPHPSLGITALSLTPSLADVLREEGEMELPMDEGVLIVETINGGPADDAGLRGSDRSIRVGSYRVPVGGDVIVALDDEPISDFQDLTVYLETETLVGDTVGVTVLRDGEERTFDVTLGARSN